MRILLLFIIITVVLSGCSTPAFNENGLAEATPLATEQPVSAGEILTREVQSPSPLPSQSPEPKPTPGIMDSKPVTRPDKLDYTALDAIDGTKRGWGVKLNGQHQVPEISAEIKRQFELYNAFYTGDISQKKIYLLFSAGYENGYTAGILDTLKKCEVKATFFLVGDYLKSNKELVKRMLDEGHQVGNESMSHPSLPDVTNSKLESELLGLEKYFNSEFGRSYKYFMPPSGEYSERVLAAAKQIGYKSIFWSFTYADFDVNNQKGADYAYNMVTKNLHNGAFIFLHTVSKDNAEALERIIIEAKAQGYVISPLDV